MVLLRTTTRSSALLLVCIVVALNAALSAAFQVGIAGPRRHHQTHSHQHGRGRPTRLVQILGNSHPEGTKRDGGHLISKLRTFAGGAGEAVDYCSEAAASKRLALLRWSATAMVVALASTTVAPSLQGFFQSYNQCLTTNPLPTKALTGAVLATAGDALAQSGEKGKPYDARRAASFAAFDSCYRLFQHIAFPLVIGNCRGRVLSSILSAVPGLGNGVASMTQSLAVAERVFTYQMMVVPLLYYPVFFSFTGLMQGLSLKGTFQRAKGIFLPCWKRNLMVWVPVQAFMFAFVPEKWQVAFTCVMGIMWSLKLSATAGKAKSD